MYLLAQDTLNGAEGKITVTRDGRITEICGMKNIKTVAGIQTSDMKTIGTRTVQKKANGVTQTGTGNVYFGSNGSNLFTDMLLQYINTGVKYSLQGTTQGMYLTGEVSPVRFSM